MNCNSCKAKEMVLKEIIWELKMIYNKFRVKEMVFKGISRELKMNYNKFRVKEISYKYKLISYRHKKQI